MSRRRNHQDRRLEIFIQISYLICQFNVKHIYSKNKITRFLFEFNYWTLLMNITGCLPVTVVAPVETELPVTGPLIVKV
jgi:hypothetical protein